jgi:phage baseplate assembly protein W
VTDVEKLNMSGALQTLQPAILKRYFIGFSTQNSAVTNVRSLYDIDLINIDLMNAFNTRVGERVMRPDYGCKLWDYMMEPMTPSLRNDIVVEATRICALDTRLVQQSEQVFQFDAGFQINIVLLYLPWQVTSTFTAKFENDNVVYFTGGNLQ